MRRQTRVGGSPAGSSRALRLDPFALPLRFSAYDAGADEQVRDVELHHERVVMRRAVRGMRMALNMPVTSFVGVAVRVLPPGDSSDGAVAIVLEHRDRSLSVPLSVAPDSDDVIADWQSWGNMLHLPLLVTEADGTLREPFARVGQIRADAPTPRRRRRGPVRRRRPSILMRRKAARLPETPTVHRDEREIIARD